MGMRVCATHTSAYSRIAACVDVHVRAQHVVMRTPRI